jgi:hypothetical protein
MPKYMLLLRSDTTADLSDFSPDDMQKVIAAYESWAGKLAAKGLLHDGKKLTDEGGKVMIPDGSGGVTIKDGPYTETKEVVGGIYLISADSYAHAAKLCQGHPNFQFGSIEIRELDLMGQPEE